MNRWEQNHYVICGYKAEGRSTHNLCDFQEVAPLPESLVPAPSARRLSFSPRPGSNLPVSPPALSHSAVFPKLLFSGSCARKKHLNQEKRRGQPLARRRTGPQEGRNRDHDAQGQNETQTQGTNSQTELSSPRVGAGGFVEVGSHHQSSVKENETRGKKKVSVH